MTVAINFPNVDEAHQVVVACDLSADPTDTRALPNLVDQIERNIGRRPKRLLADAGYYSDANLTHLDNAQIDAFIGTARTKHSDPPPTPPRGSFPTDSVTPPAHGAQAGDQDRRPPLRPPPTGEMARGSPLTASITLLTTPAHRPREPFAAGGRSAPAPLGRCRTACPGCGPG